MKTAIVRQRYGGGQNEAKAMTGEVENKNNFIFRKIKDDLQE